MRLGLLGWVFSSLLALARLHFLTPTQHEDRCSPLMLNSSPCGPGDKGTGTYPVPNAVEVHHHDPATGEHLPILKMQLKLYT